MRTITGSATVLLLLAKLAWPSPLAGADGPPSAAPAILDYRIVVTGEELLRGVYPDAHTCFITRALHLLGCHCLGSMTVDDRVEDIKEALALATNKARLVIVTGGLGPTINDVTRGALAEFTGIGLREEPAVLDTLARRFHQAPEQLRENLRRQARVPVQGAYLKNPNGTAVGLVFEGPSWVIVALPGPPRELQPMVQNELTPYLRRKFGARAPGAMLTLRFVGIGQSQIDQTLREHVPMPPDLVVSSLFESSRVDFTFALPGQGAEDQARLKQIEAALRARLGEYIYANDGSSLEEQVSRLFRARGGTLALVECGSGGHIAASLDGVKDIASLLTGAWVAPTEEQMREMIAIPPDKWAAWSLGRARVEGLGMAACALSHSQWALVVGEVTQDASGATTVWLGLGGPGHPWATQLVPVQGRGETAHASLTTQILDRVRRSLL